VVTKKDITGEAVEAARGVMVEVINLLSDYHDNIVLVGGWVPQLLCPNPSEPHSGSLDVDIALNHRKFPREGTETILELLLSRGYTKGREPFQFLRVFREELPRIVVRVDLLAGEYEGTPERKWHQDVQDVQPIKARGCDLAFENYIEVIIEGRMPNGEICSTIVKVASIVPFLVMKGMALYGRAEEKDAYDIFYCLRNYPGGMDAIVAAFKPYMANNLVKEGLSRIAENFTSRYPRGPEHVVRFLDITDEEEQARTERDAFERVDYLIKDLLK
jgi:hypothetical protein